MNESLGLSVLDRQSEQIDRVRHEIQEYCIREGLALGEEIANIPQEVLLNAIENAGDLPKGNAIKEASIRLFSLQNAHQIAANNRFSLILGSVGIGLTLLVTIASLIYGGQSNASTAGGKKPICEPTNYLTCQNTSD